MRFKKALITLSLFTFVTFTITHTSVISANAGVDYTENITVKDNRKLNNIEVENICCENNVTPTLLYAVRELKYDIDEVNFLNSMIYYSNLSETDEEVDITDALINTLDCSLSEAIEIIRVSDEIQDKIY